MQIDKPTILKLYNGDLNPAEVVIPTIPKYKESSNKIEKLQQKN